MAAETMRVYAGRGAITQLMLGIVCAAIYGAALWATSFLPTIPGVTWVRPANMLSELFTINFKELPAGAEEATLQHNGSINFIFMSDGGLPGGQPFISVLDAIQGDGFNPLWVEVQISFNPGHTPRQLFSDTEIEDAAANGEISLTVTKEVYRCAVVGPKL